MPMIHAMIHAIPTRPADPRSPKLLDIANPSHGSGEQDAWILNHPSENDRDESDAHPKP